MHKKSTNLRTNAPRDIKNDSQIIIGFGFYGT